MLVPKFKRPGKPGHIWPGVYKIPLAQKDQTNPWRFCCPAPMCFHTGAYADEAAAKKVQETHTCPWFGGGTTTISWGIMSDQFLAPMWEELDRLVNLIKDPYQADSEAPGNDREMMFDLQGQARGIAFALSRLMPPFFHTVEEISQEALVRWEKRLAGEDYETPGIGRLRFKVPPGAETKTPAGLHHEAVAGTKHSPEYHPAEVRSNHGMSDEKIALIVKQSQSGFPTRMLATVHETTENIINDILKAHG